MSMPTTRGTALLNPAQERLVNSHPDLKRSVSELAVMLGTSKARSAGAYEASRAAQARLEASKTDLANFDAAAAESGRPADQAQRAKLVAVVEQDQRIAATAAQDAAADTRQLHDDNKVWMSGLGLLNDITQRGETPMMAPTVKLPKGIQPLDGIDAERAKQQDFMLQRRDLKGARPPLAEYIGSAERSIKEQASRFPGNIALKDGGRVDISPPVVAVHAEATRHGGVPNAPDAWTLACWLMPEKVIEAVTAEVTAKYESDPDTLTMTAAERRTAMVKLDRQILESERLECAAIWAARAAGEDVHFRPDTNPRAVLGIA